jgi:hypothetical protein
MRKNLFLINFIFEIITFLRAGIETKLCGGLPSNRASTPAGARDFSLLHSIQTSAEAHPASYPMGTRVYFHGG